MADIRTMYMYVYSAVNVERLTASQKIESVVSVHTPNGNVNAVITQAQNVGLAGKQSRLE